MSSESGLIVVTEDANLARVVADTIAGDAQITASHVCRSLEELSIFMDRDNPPAAVLVDIDADPTRILEDLDSVVGRFNETRFVIVAKEQRAEWILQAMQAGARQFLVKDSIEAELLDVLHRLHPPATLTTNGSAGQILTVLSAGGGCGATTIALNIATELSIFSDSRFIGSQSPALLIDLDCHYGGVAGYLGIKAQYGVADVLRNDARIDANLVRSTAVPHDDTIHVLASPATVDPFDPAQMEYRQLARTLKAATETYLYTVVDAPRVPMDIAATLARASAKTVIVFEMNVEDIRMARIIYNGLLERGIPADRLLPLANRYRGRKEAIALKDAQSTIGSEQITHLSNEYRNIEPCINYGKSLAEQAPRSALRKEIQELAGSIRRNAGAKHHVTAQ